MARYAWRSVKLAVLAYILVSCSFQIFDTQSDEAAGLLLMMILLLMLPPMLMLPFLLVPFDFI